MIHGQLRISGHIGAFEPGYTEYLYPRNRLLGPV